MKAADRGHENSLNVLIDAGADVNVRDSYGSTSLMIAANRGHENNLKVLIHAGANVNVTDSNGLSFLMKAADRGHENSLKVLIHAGADVNAVDNVDRSALMLTASASANKAEMVQTLIDAGAYMNLTSHYSGRNHVTYIYIYIYIYSYLGSQKIADVLTEAGAIANPVSWVDSAALLNAAYYGNERCVNLLLDAGANVNVSNKDGVKALMNATCKATAKEWRSRKCTYNASEKHVVVDLLIKAGADVNATLKGGGNAVRNAVMFGHNKSLQLLINAGANVNNIGKNNTALILALITNYRKDMISETVKILLKAGAHVNKVNHIGYDATKSAKLHESSSKWIEILQLLLAAGESADMNVEEIFKCPDFEKGLKHLCRDAIRKHLLELDQNINLFQRIPKLGLPCLLTKYLLYNMSLNTESEVDHSREINEKSKLSVCDAPPVVCLISVMCSLCLLTLFVRYAMEFLG